MKRRPHDRERPFSEQRSDFVRAEWRHARQQGAYIGAHPTKKRMCARGTTGADGRPIVRLPRSAIVLTSVTVCFVPSAAQLERPIARSVATATGSMTTAFG